MTQTSPLAHSILNHLSYLAPGAPTANAFGGADYAVEGGYTLRIAEDDSVINVHLFSGGKAMLLESSMTFRNVHASLVALAASTLAAHARNSR